MRSVGLSSAHKQILVRVSAILVIAWLVMTLVPAIWPQGPVRLLSDLDDRLEYYARGRWLVDNTPAISEYPQIATYVFGISQLIPVWFDENVQPRVFAFSFSAEMFVVLFFTVGLLLKLLPTAASSRVFLMLLPPTLYFAYNRFDILPAFFSLLAFYFASNKRWSAAAATLAIAAFTKWYPILLAPGFLFYAWRQERRFQWKMLFVFVVTSAFIFLPNLLDAGWDAMLYPYQVHRSRGMEYAALPVLISNALRIAPNTDPNHSLFFAVFFALQLSGPFLTFFPRIDSLEALADYCIVAIGFFVLFSRIYSPQWMLWILPFLILSARERSDIILITLYALFCYLGFPVFYDAYGGDSIQTKLAASFMLLSLCLILGRKIRHLIKWTWLPALSRQSSSHSDIAPRQ